jgi:hypothetical protein
MRRYPSLEFSRGRYIAEWLEDNAGFRAYVLGELTSRGPLRSRDLDDRADVPWQTGGWNDGKNLGRMLEILWSQGEIAIARREGAERFWDVAERVLPVSEDDPPDEVVAVENLDRRLRAHGLLPSDFARYVDLGRLPAREVALESLLADGLAVPVAVSDLRGEWLAHRDALAELDGGAWAPRTTLLGPFDPLIHDRERTLSLFGFAFTFELYKPAAQRNYGPYALAVLHGERLIGRLDAALDRRRRVLDVRGVWEEPDAPRDARPAVQAAIHRLGEWLGAESVAMPASAPGPRSI